MKNRRNCEDTEQLQTGHKTNQKYPAGYRIKYEVRQDIFMLVYFDLAHPHM